ncbi:MAG TPA: NifB/NifX family molybdenum-iron cluster-binding protein [Halanaerobiales bacterium]|nr:NifB/NifX family molybdenum-iron cluster-binding protein [Halanaerobiales bacterium]
MKIAVTAAGNVGFESRIDLRFGRAPYFAVINTDTDEIEFVENPGVKAASGAGVMAAQLIADQEVEAVISGNYGPKAFSGLAAARLKMYSAEEGSIAEVIKLLKEGKLQEITDPTSRSHSGLKA